MSNEMRDNIRVQVLPAQFLMEETPIESKCQLTADSTSVYECQYQATDRFQSHRLLPAMAIASHQSLFLRHEVYFRNPDLRAGFFSRGRDNAFVKLWAQTPRENLTENWHWVPRVGPDNLARMAQHHRDAQLFPGAAYDAMRTEIAQDLVKILQSTNPQRFRNIQFEDLIPVASLVIQPDMVAYEVLALANKNPKEIDQLLFRHSSYKDLEDLFRRHTTYRGKRTVLWELNQEFAAIMLAQEKYALLLLDRVGFLAFPELWGPEDFQALGQLARHPQPADPDVLQRLNALVARLESTARPSSPAAKQLQGSAEFIRQMMRSPLTATSTLTIPPYPLKPSWILRFGNENILNGLQKFLVKAQYIAPLFTALEYALLYRLLKDPQATSSQIRKQALVAAGSTAASVLSVLSALAYAAKDFEKGLKLANWANFAMPAFSTISVKKMHESNRQSPQPPSSTERYSVYVGGTGVLLSLAALGAAPLAAGYVMILGGVTVYTSEFAHQRAKERRLGDQLNLALSALAANEFIRSQEAAGWEVSGVRRPEFEKRVMDNYSKLVVETLKEIRAASNPEKAVLDFLDAAKDGGLLTSMDWKYGSSVAAIYDSLFTDKVVSEGIKSFCFNVLKGASRTPSEQAYFIWLGLHMGSEDFSRVLEQVRESQGDAEVIRAWGEFKSELDSESSEALPSWSDLLSRLKAYDGKRLAKIKLSE